MPSLAEQLAAGQVLNAPQGPLASELTRVRFDEQEFQRGIRDTDWFREFVTQYGEEPDLRPMSDDPQLGPNYDYRRAWESGIRPAPDPNDDGRQHWDSALGGGEMLKSDSHPTAWKEYFMREHGVDPDTLAPEEIDRLRGLLNGAYSGGDF